ncbi:bifunctional adenosylcobinamide kinase/adenosylcobinamide-phosphate guanylyltransferase [Thalassotalea crassostreae]|uniref:bifunctional adenosylcobinamide kinase/adenosylcobinamide-phosphate guanylyltransferase n=1 Tax=Thalassotalea crassostreae TaxID=1763536 RepID=UPI000A42967E|nr:bifunctional adenosylcobinamide kinase/adenosylcobinamide-phosphate guanylyltransferase [Thalassotalea crassostreae]
MIHLILGGARSGKSSYAEQLCADIAESNRFTSPMLYVATAQDFGDEEMHDRIAKHQQNRNDDNKNWRLIECPIALSELLSELLCKSSKDKNVQTEPASIILIDCLTLWLNNIIFKLGDDAKQSQIEQYSEQLINVVSRYKNCTEQHLVLVANEVGLGIVPLGKVNRLFVDNAGWLNQKLAQQADHVSLITAGIPMLLKGKELKGQAIKRQGRDHD